MTPLLIEHGPSVTSRQMAEAAGVAEGTIFRVFPDKAAILHEAIVLSLDPEPVRDALECIPALEPMGRQLRMAAIELVARSQQLASLISVLGTLPKASFPHRETAYRRFSESNEVVLTALTRLFERHVAALNVAPRRAAVVFRGLVFVNIHPMITPDDKLSPDEVVAIALNGLVKPGDRVTA